MNTLTSDTIYSLALKLHCLDLINLSCVNSKLRKLFLSKRFDLFWKEKLKEDYSVCYKGTNARNEYLYYLRLHGQKYWTVVFSDLNNNGSLYESCIFTDKDEALFYIYRYIKQAPVGTISYRYFKALMKEENDVIDIDNTRITLNSTTIKPKSINYEEEIYRKIEDFSKKIFPYDNAMEKNLTKDIDETMDIIFNYVDVYDVQIDDIKKAVENEFSTPMDLNLIEEISNFISSIFYYN